MNTAAVVWVRWCLTAVSLSSKLFHYCPDWELSSEAFQIQVFTSLKSVQNWDMGMLCAKTIMDIWKVFFQGNHKTVWNRMQLNATSKIHQYFDCQKDIHSCNALHTIIFGALVSIWGNFQWLFIPLIENFWPIGKNPTLPIL